MISSSLRKDFGKLEFVLRFAFIWDYVLYILNDVYHSEAHFHMGRVCVQMYVRLFVERKSN